MSDKLDLLITLIEKQQQENKEYVGLLKKGDDRKRSDSVFIKLACTIVAGCALFLVTSSIDINRKLDSKADRYQLAEKLSTTAYVVSENQRAEIFLNYVDYTSRNYLVRDEELRISERGRVEKSLSAMVNMTTTRGGK